LTCIADFCIMNSSITILLVDDDPDILTFIGYNLKKEGFRVLFANNGLDAIDQAIIHHPDLILLDVMMPELYGIETCYRLRNIPGRDAISLVKRGAAKAQERHALGSCKLP